MRVRFRELETVPRSPFLGKKENNNKIKDKKKLSKKRQRRANAWEYRGSEQELLADVCLDEPSGSDGGSQSGELMKIPRRNTRRVFPILHILRYRTHRTNPYSPVQCFPSEDNAQQDYYADAIQFRFSARFFHPLYGSGDTYGSETPRPGSLYDAMGRR